MKNIFQFFIVSLTLFFAVSCFNTAGTDSKFEAQYRESFLAQTTPSVSLDGVVVRSFDKSADQIVINSTNTLYSITNFSYTSYVTANIAGTLELDERVAISYKSAGVDALSSGNVIMTVIKVDDALSTYWLWSPEKCLGFVLTLY